MKTRAKQVGLLALCLVLFLSLCCFAGTLWANASQYSPEVGEFNHTALDSLGEGDNSVKAVMNRWGFLFDNTVTNGTVSAQAQEIESKVKAKYAAVESTETPSSWIKTWDNYILQTFQVDGTGAFYGQNSALVYSPFTEEVYYMPAAYMEVRWSNQTLGYVASDVLADKEITLADGTPKTFEEIMLFQYGYIYKESDAYNAVLYQLYNEAENCFVEGEETDYALKCGEFRNQLCVGASFTIEGITYQNHQRGYIAYNAADGTYTHRGLQNMTVEGEVVTVPDYFVANDPGNAWGVGMVDPNNPDGADGMNRVKTMIESFGKTFDADALQQKFLDKLYSIQPAEICVGIPRTYVKVWDGMIVQEFWMTNGTIDVGLRDSVTQEIYYETILVYNPKTEEVSILNDQNVYNAWRNNMNKGIGFVATDMRSDVTVKDGSSDVHFEAVQFFSGGYVYRSGDTWTTVLGKEYDEATNSLVPVVNFVCGVGEKVGDIIEVTDEDAGTTVYYQNYQYGYMYTEDRSYYEYVALKNVDAEGKEAFIDDASIIARAGEFSTAQEGETALSTIQAAFDAKGKTFDQEAVAQAFKDKVLELVHAGYNVGVISSQVKVWNGAVIQDFANGDGNFSWAHGTNYVTTQGGRVRSRVTSLVYNIDKGEVYAMTGDSLNYFAWNSGRLGQLESDRYEVTNFKMPGELYARTVEIQQFEKGLVWYGENLGHAVYGGRYDAATGNVTYIPAPFVPGEYGAQQGDAISAGESVWYLNYQYGCIEAKMNFNNTELQYTYYTARQYDAEKKELSGLMDSAKEYLLGLIDTAVATASQTPEGYTDRLKAKYNEMWEQGICPGIIDGRGYIDWCNTMGIQFYYADSVAELSPNTKDNRKQIAWWVDSAADNTVYVIDNNMLNAWLFLNAFDTYGAPKGEIVYEENGDSHMLCANGTLVLAGDNWMSAAFVEDGTYQDYLASKAEKDEPSFDAPQGGCSGTVGAGISLAFGVAAVAAAAVVLARKKKEQ